MPLDTVTLYGVVVTAAAVAAVLLWLLGRGSDHAEVARSWALAFAALSAYFAIVLGAPALPPVIGLGFASGFAVVVMGAMDSSARLLCRQPPRWWGHLAAAVVVAAVAGTWLLDAHRDYGARVQLVGSITALQCALVVGTLLRRDDDVGDQERFGRLVIAVAFGGLGAIQGLRVLVHSQPWGSSEPAILAQTPLSAGVASGFLVWSVTVPIVLFYVHEVRARSTLRATVAELRETLAEVKALRGLLPMCASCRRIRDDRRQWSSLEAYLTRQAGVRISHGMCPECIAVHYPEYIERDRT
ncbi:MAG: hypothetical protein AB7U83_20060 [Vicinamibacterales bacterium]